MECPKCGTPNSNNAEVCRHCGAPLRRPRPQQSASRGASAAEERKYIIVGTLTIVFFLALIIFGIAMLTDACSSCGACTKEADEDYISENVGGETQTDEAAEALVEGEQPVEGGEGEALVNPDEQTPVEG